MRKWNLISVVAIIISTIALSISYFQPKQLEIDMFNSVVTILSLLVALLIGWQILQIINFREERTDFEKTKEDFKLEMQTQVALAEQSRSILSGSLFTFFINQQKDYEVIKYGLDLIILNLGNKDKVQTVMNALLEYTRKGITYNYEHEKKQSEILFFNYYELIESVVPVDDLEFLRKRIVSGTCVI